jgi:hypothetical protein
MNSGKSAPEAAPGEPGVYVLGQDDGASLHGKTGIRRKSTFVRKRRLDLAGDEKAESNG